MAEDDEEKKKADLRWTTGKRKQFIAKLAATYDVEAACAAAGLEWPDVCVLRVRHPEFAAAFEAVIAAGYDRLEAMLLRTAGAALAAGDGGGDVTLAANLLRQRRAIKTERANAVRPSAADAARKQELVSSIMSRLAPLQAAGARGNYGTGDRALTAGAGGAAGRVGNRGAGAG